VKEEKVSENGNRRIGENAMSDLVTMWLMY